MPMLAIPIVQQANNAAASSGFFSQRIDEILFDLLIWTGWIPIAVVLVWGVLQLWLDYRRGIYVSGRKHVLLAIDVPARTEQSPKALENMFATVYAAKSSITWKEKWIQGKLHPKFSLEIVSTEGYIQFLLRTQTRFRDVVEAGIYAHYPDAEISEVEDYAKNFPTEFPNEEYEMWGGELTLSNDEIHPIRTYVDFEDRMSQEIKDPLGYTLEQMGRMRSGEHFWIQFLIQPSNNDWAEKAIIRAKEIWGDAPKPKPGFLEKTFKPLTAWPFDFIKHFSTLFLPEGSELDLNAMLWAGSAGDDDDPWKAFKLTLPEKEEADRIFRKAQKVGFGVKTRILYVAKKNAFVKVERTAMVKGILNQYTDLHSNKFSLYIPQVPKDDYWWMRLQYRKKQRILMSAYVSRSWGIGAHPVFLNVEEIATLWHFPQVTIQAPLIKKSQSKRGEPPAGLPFTTSDVTLPGLAADGTFAQEQQASVVGIGASVDLEEGLDLSSPLVETLPRPVAPTGMPVAEQQSSKVAEGEEDIGPSTGSGTIVEEVIEQVVEELPEPVAPVVQAPTNTPAAKDEASRGSSHDWIPPNLPM